MLGHLAIEMINGLEVTSEEKLVSNSWRKFKQFIQVLLQYCNGIFFRK